MRMTASIERVSQWTMRRRQRRWFRNRAGRARTGVSVCVRTAARSQQPSKEIFLMSINVIHTEGRKRVATPAGTTREIITADDGAKDLRASMHEVEPNRSLEINSEKKTHLVYVIQGNGGQFSYKGEKYPAKKG